MEKVGFVAVSGNRKTGGIPVSTTSASTCPDSCPLKNKGCYAQLRPLSLHWRNVTEGRWGLEFGEFLRKIEELPEGTLWRHAQAGDLPGKGDRLDVMKLRRLSQANIGKKGYTYTHKPLRREIERKAVKEACEQGFTINLSADTLKEADELLALGIAPVVSLVPLGSKSVLRTPGGALVKLCRHQISGIRCSDCRACAKPRKWIVGFLPHGGRKAKADLVARG